MQVALPMLPMLPSDRSILRNLVIVVVASTGGAMLVGMSCLNRGIMSHDFASVRSSAGGVAPNATGVTSLTSFDTPPPGQLSPQMNSAMNRPRQPPPEPSFDPRDPNAMHSPNGAMSAPPAAPMMRNAPAPIPTPTPAPNGTNYAARPAPSNPTTMAPYVGQSAPDGAVPYPPNAAPTVPPVADSGATPRIDQQQPQQAPTTRFATEAPPWAASNYQSNPEAGAGQFITDTPPAR